MKLPLALYAALLWRRANPLQILAAAVTAAALFAVMYAIPARQEALRAARAQLEDVRKTATPTSHTPPAAENRLLSFRNVLGARHENELHIDTLLGIARDKALLVRKAEYRSAPSKAGQYHIYQVTLPFQSAYGPVRAFCDEVLRALPFASIDSVQFSRNAVDVSDLEAKVVVTFFLGDGDLAASGPAPARSSANATPGGAVLR